MFFQLLTALILCIPCLGTAADLPSTKVKEKWSFFTRPNAQVVVTSTFLTTVNRQLQKNDLKVLSKREINSLVKSQLAENSNYEENHLDKEFLLLKDSFGVFARKILTKNSGALTTQYQISIPTASFVEDFFVQLLPTMARHAREKSGNALFDTMVEKASPEFISSLYGSFFPQAPVDFSPILTLCQQQGLLLPPNQDETSEYVHSLLQLNMSQEGVLKMNHLTTDHTLFTRWTMLSIKTALDENSKTLQLYLLATLRDLPQEEKVKTRSLIRGLNANIKREDPNAIARVSTLIALLSLIHEQQQTA